MWQAGTGSGRGLSAAMACPLVRISQVACWEVSGKTVSASCPLAVIVALSELLRGGSVHPLQFITAVLEEMGYATSAVRNREL